MKPLITITPKSHIYGLNKIWLYKELIYFLVWRDIKVKYKQTLAGVLWVIIQPFTTMVLFSFLFSSIAKISTYNIPYPIFVFSGLLFWNLFSQSIITASESLIANYHLIKNVSFPRIILPISAIIINLIDFFFASVVLFFLMVYFHFVPQVTGLIALPIAIFLSLILALGIGAIVATLNLYFRDIKYLLTYFLQILLFVSPIVYPKNLVGSKLQILLIFNPVSGIIDYIRSSLLGLDQINSFTLLISILICIVVFISGTIFFMKQENKFTDII